MSLWCLAVVSLVLRFGRTGVVTLKYHGCIELRSRMKLSCESILDILPGPEATDHVC